MTFSEIEHTLENGAASLKEHAAGIFHHGVATALKELQAVEAVAKADALVAVKNASPEIQAAVQLAVEAVEKSVLAYIESRLA